MRRWRQFVVRVWLFSCKTFLSLFYPKRSIVCELDFSNSYFETLEKVLSRENRENISIGERCLIEIQTNIQCGWHLMTMMNIEHSSNSLPWEFFTGFVFGGIDSFVQHCQHLRRNRFLSWRWENGRYSDDNSPDCRFVHGWNQLEELFLGLVIDYWRLKRQKIWSIEAIEWKLTVMTLIEVWRIFLARNWIFS